MRLIIASPPSLGQQPTSQSTLADSVPGVVASLCLQYGIEPARVFLRPMPRTGSGLGNAIPLPFPRRRLSLIRFHPCMRQADPLALRGLFAHELIHAKHYFESRWTDLIRFMFRYGLFLLTSQGTRTIGEDWVRQIELLTDLLAVKLGEGASIAAWGYSKPTMRLTMGALSHGRASKYEIQMVFPQQRFPPTVLLREDHSQAERMQTLRQFGSDHGYPIILKPDLGRVGMGVALVHDEAATRCFLDEVKASYIAQEFVPGPLEFGVFYVRRNGVPDLFSINSKDFPAVTGDGCDSVSQLIERDPRLSSFGKLFNQTNFHRIPSRGETVQLSIVGSHTLGCIFRDASALKTRPLIEAIHESVGVSGFNSWKA